MKTWSDIIYYVAIFAVIHQGLSRLDSGCAEFDDCCQRINDAFGTSDIELICRAIADTYKSCTELTARVCPNIQNQTVYRQLGIIVDVFAKENCRGDWNFTAVDGTNTSDASTTTRLYTTTRVSTAPTTQNTGSHDSTKRRTTSRPEVTSALPTLPTTHRKTTRSIVDFFSSTLSPTGSSNEGSGFSSTTPGSDVASSTANVTTVSSGITVTSKATDNGDENHVTPRVAFTDTGKSTTTTTTGSRQTTHKHVDNTTSATSRLVSTTSIPDDTDDDVTLDKEQERHFSGADASTRTLSAMISALVFTSLLQIAV